MTGKDAIIDVERGDRGDDDTAAVINLVKERDAQERKEVAALKKWAAEFQGAFLKNVESSGPELPKKDAAAVAWVLSEHISQVLDARSSGSIRLPIGTCVRVLDSKWLCEIIIEKLPGVGTEAIRKVIEASAAAANQSVPLDTSGNLLNR